MSAAIEKTRLPIHGWVAPGFERVRDVFTANFEDIEVGAGFCAIHDGRTVVDLWGGYRDRECAEPWTEDTLVNVYSTTKGLGAAVIALLVDEGKLDYEAPVARYWPELRAARDGLTVGQLLSHQGGLPGVRQRISVEDLYDWKKIVRLLEQEEPRWKPGTGAGYHAITWGYLAGELALRTTGKSLGRLLQERLAEPLGADVHIGLPDHEHARVSCVIGPNHARKQPPPEPLPKVPALYAVALMNPVIRPFKDVGTAAWRRAEIAAANGHATAKGLARLYGALAHGGELDGVRVVSSETIAAAVQERSAPGLDLVLGRVMRRANGFILNTDGQYGPNDATFGHSGAGGSYGIGDAARRLGVGYTMNQMQPGLDPDTRGKRLIDAVYACLSR